MIIYIQLSISKPESWERPAGVSKRHIHIQKKIRKMSALCIIL
jgi:hypothetical protein